MAGLWQADVSPWTWAGASSRGTSHIQAGSRKQDAYTTFSCRSGTVLATIVSDGAGSALLGGEGASLTCRTLATSIKAHFEKTGDFPSDGELMAWIDAARDRIGLAAAKRQKAPRDFAATLILVLSDGQESLTVHIGDGSAVARYEDNLWRALSWPAQGEYASTTFFVTDDPEPAVKISRSAEPVSAIAVFTDGIERLALNYGLNEPHQPFFKGIILPLDAAVAKGRDFGLSAQLLSYLSSPAINERTDDDKTLVLAVRR